MNFNELDLSLPNGFHDAALKHFEMDYAHSTLTFDLVVWLGMMEPATKTWGRCLALCCFNLCDCCRRRKSIRARTGNYLSKCKVKQ